VEANTKVVAVNAKATADLVFIALLEENGAQKVAVGGAEFLQDPANVGLSLLIDEGALQIDDFIGDVQMANFQWAVFVLGAGVLA
jgi:hypothetical protein